MGLFLGGTGAAAQEPATLQTLEKLAGEWVRIRAETTKLTSSWGTEKALLASTIESLEARAELLEEKRGEWLAKTADERREIEALRRRHQVAGQEISQAEGRLQKVSAELIALRPTLPPRLSDALEMAFRSLAGNELSAGERMQIAMTILNRCSQFNHSISHGEEVFSPEPGAPGKLVEVIYWGLSHGYALDRQAGQAWLGAPREGRWAWQVQPGAAPLVAKLIAIQKDEADPDFVVVPAQLVQTTAKTPQP